MKNLRKVLSFVLVLAMVLGMVTTAFAATTYSDAAGITNEEATTVLSAIKVLDGFPDGTFKPAQALTRAQGAAIIARLVLGRDTADKLVAVQAPFSDVPTTNFYAGYISWAAANGVINGYGNGKFGPEDTLTATQFTKMALTALGYKSENEGFTGDNWANNVSNVANEAGLLKGVVLAGTTCTRDVAAQVAFNVLLAKEVKYSGGATVTAGDTKIQIGAVREEKGTFVDNHYAEATKVLTKSAVTTGLFGRPDKYDWKYADKIVYTSAAKTHLVATYKDAVKKTTVYELLGKDICTATGTNLLDVYVDGVKDPAFTVMGDVAAKTGTATVSGTGIGATTEIYKNSDTNIDVIIINTYLAKATTDYNKTSEKVTVSVEGYTKTLSADDFAIANVKKNDYFLVTMDAGVVKTLVPVTKATGKVTSYTSGSALVIDGVSYSYNQKFADTKTTNKTGFTIGGTIDYILDASNNLIDIIETELDYNYIFVAATKSAVGYGSTSTLINAYDVDGVNVTDVKAEGLTDAGWYKYTVNTDGSYKLTRAGLTLATPTNMVVTGGAANFTSDIVASKDTKFTVLYTKDGKTTVTTYVGYQNLPSYEAATTHAILTTTGGFATNVVLLTAKTAKDVSSANADYAMLYKADFSEGVDANKVEIKTYKNAIVNGEDATVVVTKDCDGQMNLGKLYKLSAKNAAGYVTALSEVSGTGFTTKQALSSVKYATGVVKLDDVAQNVSDDCVVYVVSGSAFEVMDASAFANNYANGGFDCVTLVLDANKIATAIYACD